MARQTKPIAAHAVKRILVVDDHPIMREGVTHWIDAEPDLQVCGEASTADEALKAIETLKPDLVLTDITLPGRGGLDLLKDIQALHPGLPVLVLSMHEESLYAERALRAGARGYLVKRAGGDKVVQCIRDIFRGQIALPPSIATDLLERYAGQRAQPLQPGLASLTDREFEVFQLLGRAKSNREIAAELHLSPKTVETHRINIRQKLKLKSTPELIRYALQCAEAGQKGG